ncbi:hypothetical protein psyc5s11_50590 [Clostridium gelidum]|uniref:Replication initiation protein n=1 Tax=Clostridium gelidum TaxID=704125 RepID=A0ABN6J7I2_9CLOT|nr:hypothetical protein [Clostridium gelidum]BCZ48992.1 hypothetical protein psyc5s11_50590 [Clostridium gelidum]
MATKLYNSHLSKIIFECNEYYILDTYISLVAISSEVNSKYLIQTFTSSKADLIALVRRNLNVSYKTVFNCVNKLIEKSILAFDNILDSWILVNMENMTKAKDNLKSDLNSEDYLGLTEGTGDKEFSLTAATRYEAIGLTGYTHIRSFFFTPEFRNMKAREKRLMIYMSELSDSKASKFHDGFSMNLLKLNSGWMKVLKTKCKYYAKYTIDKMLIKYSEIFKDNSETERLKDLSPKKNTNFKFYFECAAINTKTQEDDYIELVKLNNPKEYNLVMEKIKFAEITLTKKLVMHLVRAIANLKEWFLKERITQLIVNKYRAIQIHKSRENIKSLPAYAAAVVRSVVNEYKRFKTNIILHNVSNYEVGEYFMEYASEKEAYKAY